MMSDAEYDYMAAGAAAPAPEYPYSRSPSPTLPFNVLHPEKEFILTFETIPELWDTKNIAYTNKYKRNENLAKLLPIFKKIKPNATIEDVKKKINCIRSSYRRELKRIQISKRSGAGADEIYVPKLWYFPYLKFLEKLEQPVPLQVLQQTLDPIDQGESTIPQRNQESSNENMPERSFSSISTIPRPSISSTNKKKKSNHEELLSRACQYLSEPCQTNQQVHLSNPIALEWSNTLDRLDPMQRLLAKKAINDILFEAELGNLNRESVKINNPSSTSQHTAHMTYNRSKNCSPLSHHFSSDNSTLTFPLPPSSPSLLQTLTSPAQPSSSPQHTAHNIMTYNSSQCYNPYSDHTYISPPPPSSPSSQQTLSSHSVLSSFSPQHTASIILTNNTTRNFSSLQRGKASQIVLNGNNNPNSFTQIPTTHSSE